ncbi:hypothetical protein BH20ACT8_BH20ACT8_11970 [soil metagenome]|jgi:hypothetical protein
MTTSPSSSDTSKDVQARLVEGWRQMSAARRFALVDAWSRDIRVLAEVGIRRRAPSATSPETLIELGRVLYGREVVTDEVAVAVRARTDSSAGP